MRKGEKDGKQGRILILAVVPRSRDRVNVSLAERKPFDLTVCFCFCFLLLLRRRCSRVFVPIGSSYSKTNKSTNPLAPSCDYLAITERFECKCPEREIHRMKTPLRPTKHPIQSLNSCTTLSNRQKHKNASWPRPVRLHVEPSSVLWQGITDFRPNRHLYESTSNPQILVM